MHLARKFLFILFLPFCIAQSFAAEQWPAGKPIRLIVPFPAGGGAERRNVFPEPGRRWPEGGRPVMGKGRFSGQRTALFLQKTGGKEIFLAILAKMV